MLGWIFKSHKGTAPESSTPGPPHSPGVGVEDPVAAVSQKLDTALQSHRAGRLSEAEAAYSEVLAVDPENIDALHFLGVIAYQRGEHRRAEELISRALSREPSNAPAYNNLGNALGAQGKLDAAMVCYERALALQPEYADALVNLGAAFRAKGELDKAVQCYQRALSLAPDVPMAHFNLGNVLRDEGRLDEAIPCYRKAISLKPDFPEGHAGLGDSLKSEGRLDEAIACYRKALALKPDFPEAHFHLGDALREQDRFSEALGHYQKALSLKPEYAEARWFLAMSQIPAVYEADADPGRHRAAFSRELEALERWFDTTRIAEGFQAVGVHQPFYLAYQEENNRDLLKRYGNLCTRLMSEWFARQGFAASAAKREPDRVIRIGIVSKNFRNHSVWNAIVRGWFERLDRKRVSLHAFYLGFDQDRETLFAQARASHFAQGGRGLRQWVEAIIGQQLDVLIYPEIGMDPKTVPLASLRLAPVQIATWGHPETTGLPTIDYYLSAKDLEPPDAQENYTEELVTLPHLGCFYKSPQVVAVEPDLGKLGIDPASPLLLCSGVPFKYAPQHDWIFTEIARRLGRCRFIFFTHQTRNLSEKLRRRLETVFAQSRLKLDDFVTFIPWQNWPEFHGLLKRADVFLDTIGFSGFNTAMQAVECGLPIVTREGRFLRGRLASGILRRMGLQELVAGSEEDYIALALKLVQDGEYRERIRERIEADRHILFEDLAPIRALEDFLARVTIQRRG